MGGRREEGELAEDVNHSFTGHNTILALTVRAEMPLKEPCRSCVMLVWCSVKSNHACINCILHLYKHGLIQINISTAIRKKL